MIRKQLVRKPFDSIGLYAYAAEHIWFLFECKCKMTIQTIYANTWKLKLLHFILGKD